jgi:hypothetical protein
LVIPVIGILVLIGVRSQIGSWTIAELAMVGIVLGVAVPAAMIAVRRRSRHRMSARERLRSLEPQDLERPPRAMESLELPQRESFANGFEESRSNGDGTAIGDQGSSGKQAGGSVVFLSDRRDHSEDPPGSVEPTPRAVESTQEFDGLRADAEFDGLTAEELAVLFNRYEQLSRDNARADNDERSEADADLWLDLIEGPASASIDAARSSAGDRWIQLHSGDAVCKPLGRDAWIWIEIVQEEPTAPFVAPSPAPVADVVEPTSVIVIVIRSDFERIGPTPELSAIGRSFE